jgi:site-specific DNA recombinase
MLKSGTSIITEKEGIINFGEDIAKDFLSDVIASAAKYERGMIKQRVKRAMLERTSKGLQVGTLTGIFGYDYHEGNIVINDKEAEIVRLIFKMYIEGKGYHSIKNYLNENGYRTKFGNTFKSCNIKRILEKPTYCGYITHLDKVIKGVHQPIISEDIFNQAQNRYSQNKKRNPKMKVKHLLTGFLHCGSCNSRMQIGYHGGKAFYECSAYYTGNCKKPVYIGKDILENYVIGKVVKIISKMDLKFDSEKKVKQESNLFEVKINQQKIKQKIDRLLEQYVEGNIDEVNYRRLNDKLRKELNQAKTIKENPKIDLSFLKDFKIEKVWHELEFIDKRKILEVLIDRVVVERYNRKDKLTDRVKITFNKFQS